MTSIKHSRRVGRRGEKNSDNDKKSLTKQPGEVISGIGGWNNAKLKALWWREMTSEG